MNIEYICPNCQAVIVQGLNFCTSCGLELTENQIPDQNADKLDDEYPYPPQNLDIETILNMHEGTSKKNKDRPFYTKKSYWLALFVLLIIANNYCGSNNDQDLQPVTKSTMAIYSQNESLPSDRFLL